MQPEPAHSSRLLRGAEQKQAERKERQAPAISYRTVRKGVDDHV